MSGRCDDETVRELVGLMLNVRRTAGQLWLLGNGGSLVNCLHLATDLASPLGPAQQGWRVTTLGAQPALSSANANDGRFVDALAAEVRVFVQPRDTVLALSVSGTSPNVLRALGEARRRGAHTAMLVAAAAERRDDAATLVRYGEGTPAQVEAAHCQVLAAAVAELRSGAARGSGRAAVLVDRNGTLTDEGFGTSTAVGRLVMNEAIVDVLREAVDRGLDVFLVSNQADVGRGKVSLDEHWSSHKELMRALAQRGIPLRDAYYCLHAPADRCRCRKPRPGLLLQCVRDWAIDPTSAMMVGNTVTDAEAARHAGMRYFRSDADLDELRAHLGEAV